MQVSQYSYGTTTGQVISAYVTGFDPDSSGHLEFVVNLTNHGTLPYQCSDLVASVVTNGGTDGPDYPSNQVDCPGPSNMLSSLDSTTFGFDIPLNGGFPETIVVSPFGIAQSAVLEWGIAS